MLLSIIIVSYNTKALTVQTLESVFAEVDRSSKLRDAAEVFVVDNDSSDDSVEAIQKLTKKHSDLHLIENYDNLGFGSANNQAIKKAKGQFILLLNSDTIVQPGAFIELLSAFEKDPLDKGDGLHHFGILSAQLYNPDDTIQAQGGSFPTLFSLASHMLFLDDLPLIGKLFPSTQHTGRNQRISHSDSVHPQDWVGGTAMMIRKATFDEIGLLDRNIFMYGEDIELCIRAKSHHWRVGVVPNAKITHFGSASSSSKNAVIGELKGYLYIWAKHKPLWQRPFVKSLLLVGVYLRRFLFGTMIKDNTRSAIYREAAQVLHSL